MTSANCIAQLPKIWQGGMAPVSVDGDSSRTDPANIPEDVATLVLAATPTIDPIADDQPWRLCFKLTKDTVRVYAATPLQILDDGTVSVSGKGTVTQSGSETRRTSACHSRSTPAPSATTVRKSLALAPLR